MFGNIIRTLKRSIRYISDKLGLKIAIKTSIAVSLSLFLGLVFNKIFKRPDALISGLWCVLATIIVLQTQLGGTYKAAWVRFSGVAIGSIIGSLFFIYLGADHLASLGVSIFLTIVICSLLNLKDSFRIACLSTAIIIIYGGINPTLDPWTFSFFRFIDSCIGIIAAVFVAHILWAEKASENLRLNILKILRLLSKQYRLVLDTGVKKNVDLQTIDQIFFELQELSYKNLDYIEESKLELPSSAQKPEDWLFIINQLDIISESISALRNINFEILTKIFDDSLSTHITNLISTTDAGINDLENLIEKEKTPVHLNRLKDVLKDLNQDLLRFRATRTTRKFNIEDVESFFVFFYRVKIIGETVIKIADYIQKSQTPSLA
jgi:uncharacterized membrane protein YccC